MKNLLHKIYRDSLLKNSSFIIVTSFSNSIMGFFFWIVAARYYIPSDIGITSALISGMSLITMTSSIGLSRALFYYLPRNEQNANDIINSCIIINFLTSFLFLLMFILGIDILAPDLKLVLKNIEHITIFIIITIIINISTIIGVALTAGRKSSFYMTKETIFYSTKIIPLFLFTNLGAIGIFLSIGIGMTISVAIGFILLYNVWRYSPKLILHPIIKSMVRFSFGNYIADILYSLPRLILPFMILNSLSDKSAGYFYIAFTMASLLYGIPQSISTSLLVESFDKEKLSNNIDNAIKFNLGLLIPGVLLFIIFGKLVLTIFNPMYAENSFYTLIILTLASIPLSIVNIFNTIRNAQNRVSSLIKMNLLVAIITIILSVFLIKIGIEGLAISFLIANIVGAMMVIQRVKSPIVYIMRLIKDYRNIIHI